MSFCIRHARRLAAIMLGLLTLWSAAAVHAQSKAIVLGIRSIEGDDSFAKSMTDALREAAAGNSQWAVAKRSVSMTQMALAHGCDEVDALCLSDIAKGLKVASIVYGTVTRSSARQDFDFRLMLSLYDANTGSIVHSINETIPRGEVTPEALATRASAMVQQLAGGSSRVGRISVRVNVRTAEVRLNGQLVGQTRDRTLALEGVQPGAYEIEISARGHRTYSEELTVDGGRQASVLAVLEELDDDELDDEPDSSGAEIDASMSWDEPRTGSTTVTDVIGYVLLAVGGLSLVGVPVSWLVIKSINDDALFLEYKDAVANGDPSVTDACDEAERGQSYGLGNRVTDVAEMCSTASTAEVVQWVLLGTAVVTGTTGAIILMTSSDDSKGASLALRPVLGTDYQGIRAQLRF